MNVKDFIDYKVSGIYMFNNLQNQHKYIGQAKNIYSRLYSHLRSTIDPNKKDYNTPLHCAIRKYGLDTFEVIILEECSGALLNEREQFWIAKYDTHKNGYNQTDGGYQSIRLIKLTPEQLMEIYNLLENNVLSNAAIAKKFGITSSTVQKINSGLMWHTNNKKYPIRPNSKENSARYYLGKAVQQIDKFTDEVIAVYSSTRQAALMLNNENGYCHIVRCCNNRQKTAFGYRWQYINISADDWRKLVIKEKNINT